jgi:hypothetical protein
MEGRVFHRCRFCITLGISAGLLFQLKSILMNTLPAQARIKFVNHLSSAFSCLSTTYVVLLTKSVQLLRHALHPNRCLGKALR